MSGFLPGHGVAGRATLLLSSQIILQSQSLAVPKFSF